MGDGGVGGEGRGVGKVRGKEGRGKMGREIQRMKWIYKWSFVSEFVVWCAYGVFWCNMM